MTTTKDCACLTHDGPHWQHMDTLDRQWNHELLEQTMRYKEDRNFAMFTVTLHCHAQAELRRLAEKLAALRKNEDTNEPLR
jgi:hypothetical protein